MNNSNGLVGDFFNCHLEKTMQCKVRSAAMCDACAASREVREEDNKVFQIVMEDAKRLDSEFWNNAEVIPGFYMQMCMHLISLQIFTEDDVNSITDQDFNNIKDSITRYIEQGANGAFDYVEIAATIRIGNAEISFTNYKELSNKTDKVSVKDRAKSVVSFTGEIIERYIEE